MKERSPWIDAANAAAGIGLFGGAVVFLGLGVVVHPGAYGIRWIGGYVTDLARPAPPATYALPPLERV